MKKQTTHCSAEQLQKILAVTAQINSTLELDKLLGVIMNTAAEVMNTEAASLMLLDSEGKVLIFHVALGCKASQLKENFTVKMGEGIAGSVAETGRSVVVNNVRTDPRFAKRFDDSTGFKTEAILCVPLHAKGKIIGVLEAINPHGRKEFSQEDLELFQIFADQAAIAVENARLHSEVVSQEKAKQELRIAHEIQQSFLPDIAQLGLSAEIAASSLPARSVGGDLYDVAELEGKIAMVIGDVSGKGVPAALYMVRAVSEYRFLVPRMDEPAVLLTELNKLLAKNSPFGMFLTFFYACLDKDKKILRYASAGHHPMLRRRASGAVDSIPNPGGPPLGLMEDSTYQSGTLKLEAGDILLLYTDGVTEARDKKGGEYTIERLLTCVGKCADGAAGQVAQVLADVQEFCRGTEPHDDTTVIALRIP